MKMNTLHHWVCAQDKYYPVAFVSQWSKMVLHFKVSCKASMLKRSLYFLLFHRRAISPAIITERLTCSFFDQLSPWQNGTALLIQCLELLHR